MKSLRDYLIEKALARRDYLSIVSNIAPVILEHVLLIHMFPDDMNVNHWKGEIKGHMKRMTNMKIKNVDSSKKRLSLLNTYLLTDPFDDLDAGTMENEIFAIASDKDMMIRDKPSQIWQRIESSVRSFYSICIEYVSEGDLIGLYTFIDKYEPGKSIKKL